MNEIKVKIDSGLRNFKAKVKVLHTRDVAHLNAICLLHNLEYEIKRSGDSMTVSISEKVAVC